MSFWRVLRFVFLPFIIYVSWLFLGGKHQEASALALVVFVISIANPLNTLKTKRDEKLDSKFQHNKKRINDIEKERIKHHVEQEKKRVIEELKQR
ncbi:MAG: hypothetical protein ACTTJS_02430 [Wolinella sp.]